MGQAVNELIDWLRRHQQRIDLDQLKNRLDDERLNVGTLADYIRFSEERYSRNLLAHGPQFYALVLCWMPGQASPIHDHKGASCGVRIIQGTATETRFDWSGEQLKPQETTVMHAGEICGSFDDDIHEIRNNGSENLVTLHVYSPYLNNINLYDLGSGKVTVFSDPLVETLSA